MTDTQHPPEALCGPEELLKQIRTSASVLGLQIAGALRRCSLELIVHATAVVQNVFAIPLLQ